MLFKRSQVATTEHLETTVQPDEVGVSMYLHGRLGIDSSPDFRNQLLAILREQTQGIVTVDLTDVSYIDSSGIATLIEALRVAHSHGITLGLRGLQGRLVHLFEVTGVMALFEKSGCLVPSSGAKVI
jgi:anti-sigma B factor antagonist